MTAGHRIHSFSASDRLVGRALNGPRSHPYLVGSIGLHALALLALAGMPGMGASEQARSVAAEASRAQQQMALTEARELQRQVERMAEIRREMSQAAGEPAAPPAPATAGASPAELLARAQSLSASIEALERKLRAAELARMTGLSPDEAARRLAIEAADERRPPPAGRPAETVASLERRAQEILEQRRAQAGREREGTRVSVADDPAPKAAGTARKIPKAGGTLASPLDQVVAMLRPGEEQGRVGVSGVEGGTSLDPRSAAATRVVGDRRPEDDLPVTTPGGSLDLTKPLAERWEAAPPATARNDGSDAVRNPGGRVFGPGGIFATRVYLDSWYVIGPFAGQGRASMETMYPPEGDIDLDGVYPGLDGRVLAWRYASRGFYPFVPPDLAGNAVYYAFTEILVDEERDAWLDIGADDDSKLWLDGRLIWVSEPGDKRWYKAPFYLPDERTASLALVEGRRRVHLGRGVHRLLVKLYNKADQAFFSVVVASSP
jgi:hypothetical protein